MLTLLSHGKSKTMYANKVMVERKTQIQKQSAYARSWTDENSLKTPTVDVPRVLLQHTNKRVVRAELVSNEGAVIAGLEELGCEAESMGLEVYNFVSPGMDIRPGSVIAAFTGNPLQVVRGEDALPGLVGKASGIATAARRAVRKAGRIKVVCGGWKKIPMELKERFRCAVEIGGAEIRMLAKPFVYLDKNYIRILGSLPDALHAAQSLPGRALILQLRGETDKIEKEAIMAVKHDSEIVMVDTGSIDDVRRVSRALKQERLREKVQIAFAGGVTLNDLEDLQQEDIDIVDIGRAILDAPLIDLRYDVVNTESELGDK